MRYLLYILTMIVFSCDSIDEFEVFQDSFNYFDYVAYGWAEFFKENYDDSINYFNLALTIADVDEDGTTDNKHHSAYVGLFWVNNTVNNANFDNLDQDELDDNRLSIVKKLAYYQNNGDVTWIEEVDCTSGVWDDGTCIIDLTNLDNSDDTAASFYNVNENLTGTKFCEQDYCCNDCFIQDKQVSFIYFYESLYDNGCEECYEKAIEVALDFLSSINSTDLLDLNIDYDFMNGKPHEGLPEIDLNYQDIIAKVGNLYLKKGEYVDAAKVLFNGGLCIDIINLNDINVLDIIDCVENYF